MNDPDPATAEGARLELLAKLVEDYELQRFKFKKPDPVDAIIFRMEQQGSKQKDIASLLGGKTRASEILARKRPLTLTMIRALHESAGASPFLPALALCHPRIRPSTPATARSRGVEPRLSAHHAEWLISPA
ncbi:MAG TPA: transcriptional regulator [Burkholderiales bacterium]|nr:transcriptional regulator [Burkholderiales bacterium]